MSFFKKTKVAKGVEEGHVDTLGGGTPILTGVYPAKITAMYGIMNDKGALSVQIEATISDGEFKDRKLYNRAYCVNANGETFYERDGKKHHYAGFLQADAIALIATDLEYGLLDLEDEERTVKLREDGKDIEKRVPVFVEALGANVQIGVIRANKYKQKQTDDGYVDTDEVYQTTEWDHIFNEDGFTVNEMQNEAEEPEFVEQWLERWEGKEKQLPKKKESKSAGNSGSRTRSSSSDRGSRNTSASRQRRGFIEK